MEQQRQIVHFLLMLLVSTALPKSLAFFLPSRLLPEETGSSGRFCQSSFASSLREAASLNRKSSRQMVTNTSSPAAQHATMPTSLPEEKQYPIKMTESERYLFDLNGFLVVRNVLNAEEVRAANEAIDRHITSAVERSDVSLRNAKPGTPMYGSGPGRKDLGGVLEWGSVDSHVFKSILRIRGCVLCTTGFWVKAIGWIIYLSYSSKNMVPKDSICTVERLIASLESTILT